MTDLILHHYDPSPFAEKIRILMGLKSLAWQSVEIPVIMPKPDLMPLTGGFRRTPVLQISADIFCDTQRIAAELERRYPNPTLFPGGGLGLHTAVATWADKHIFGPAVGYAMGTYADKMPAEFFADRAAMRGGKPDMARTKAAIAPSRAMLEAQLSAIEASLSDGRAFLLGDAAGVADAAVYHCAWFVSTRSKVAPTLDAYPNLLAWIERVKGIGHGERSELEAKDALEIATAAAPESVVDAGDDRGGVNIGDRVSVLSDDRVPAPVVGELVINRRDDVAVRRNDDKVGEVVVHFPRLGYTISLAKPA
jgi:glutathione S-transferase